MKIQFYTDGDDSVGIPGETVEIETFDLLEGFDEEERAGFVSDIQDTLRRWMDGTVRTDYQPERKPDGHMRSFAFRVDRDEDGKYVATDLPPMEPTGEWHSFTWDRNTGEMTPRDDDKPEEPR